MIKHLLMCSAVLGFTFGVNAQALRTVKPAKGVKLYPTSVQVSPVLVKKDALKINDQPSLSGRVGPTIQAAAAFKKGNTKSFGIVQETVIGTTDYDLQSNVGIAKRISNNGDGTLSAVYTGSQVGMGDGTWSDRGTFYAYYDGTTWSTAPTTRLEGTTRTGWPNMCVNNGMEYSVAHSGGPNGLILSSRMKGTGTWTSSPNAGGAIPTGGSDIWARMAVGGGNGQTLHIIVNSQGSGTSPILGQNGPITYSRSLDGGITWDIQHIVLPGLDSSNYLGWGADSYHIDANGDNVAIVLAESLSDVVLMKSTDNGTTWTKTVVQESPLGPMYVYNAIGAISDIDGDSIADQVETSNGDVTVTVDPNGVAHLAWGAMVYIDDDTTDGPNSGFSYFPTVDGIVYWNETMIDPVLAATAPDLNGDSVISVVNTNAGCGLLGLYGGGGLSVHPSIGYDASGNIYMSYASVCELADTTVFGLSMRHVYAIKSTDGGTTWSLPLTLVPLAAQGGDGEFQEAVYPSLAKVVDSKIHVLYERDNAPGHSLLSGSPTADCQAINNLVRNDIIYVTADVTDFVTGINEATSPSANFSISQNYPNPFITSTRFDINLKQRSDVTLEVFNMIGELVQTSNMENVPAGISTLSIDGSVLKSGVYSYSVIVNGEKVTRMMIVQ